MKSSMMSEVAGPIGDVFYKAVSAEMNARVTFALKLMSVKLAALICGSTSKKFGVIIVENI